MQYCRSQFVLINLLSLCKFCLKWIYIIINKAWNSFFVKFKRINIMNISFLLLIACINIYIKKQIFHLSTSRDTWKANSSFPTTHQRREFLAFFKMINNILVCNILMKECLHFSFLRGIIIFIFNWVLCIRAHGLWWCVKNTFDSLLFMETNFENSLNWFFDDRVERETIMRKNYCYLDFSLQ